MVLKVNSESHIPTTLAFIKFFKRDGHGRIAWASAMLFVLIRSPHEKLTRPPLHCKLLGFPWPHHQRKMYIILVPRSTVQFAVDANPESRLC
jgi:hypothetical protein